MWISRPTRYITLILWLSFYYLSYRYILQINSHSTSMTYSDTPISLQAAKYIIFLVIVVFYIFWGWRERVSISQSLFDRLALLVYALLAFYPLFIFIFNPKPYYIEVGIFFILLLPALIILPEQISLKTLSDQFSIFIGVSILWEIMQVALYHLIGRLPALAWGTAASVRYGSIWDDPNGYGIFMSFMVPFVYFRYRRRPWVVAALIGLLLIFMILTRSMTGMATLGISLVLGVGLLLMGRPEHKKGLLGLLTIVPVFFVMLGVHYFATPPVPAEVVASKRHSIEIHKQAYRVLIDSMRKSENNNQQAKPGDHGNSPMADTQRSTKPDPRPARPFVQTESGYVNIMINTGWFYLLMYLMAGAIGLIMLYQVLLNNYSAPGLDLCYGAYFFIIAYFTALINLPFEQVFPINVLMVISLLVAHCARMQSVAEPSINSAQGEVI